MDIISVISLFTQLYPFFPKKYHVEMKLYLEEFERSNNCKVLIHLADSLEAYL